MNRPITSCLTCRRRKVRCDRLTPVCSACQKGHYNCAYQSSGSPQRSFSPSSTPRTLRSRRTGKKTRSAERSLDGLQASSIYQRTTPLESCANSPRSESAPVEEKKDHSQPNGVLILDEECSRLVSPLHWASVKEVSGSSQLDSAVNQSGNGQAPDLKDVVMDRTKSTDLTTVSHQSYDGYRHPLPYNVHPPHSSFMGLLLGSGLNDNQIALYYPETLADCQFLLDTFTKKVEPIIHLVHHPTLQQHFQTYISSLEIYASPAFKDFYGLERPSHFEPLAFGIFFSAVYSMDPAAVEIRFGTSKSDLLRRFQNGIELALEKQDLLSSPAIPVLQAFVLFLTCLCRDDDIQRVWALVGLAIRIAQSLGLHQEPTLYPSKKMDAIQVEVRRRLWHQIFYLDFRTASSQGLPPFITANSFTTRLPSNVNDKDLVPGQAPLPDQYDPGQFTDMTMQLVRLNGIHCMQQLLHKISLRQSPDIRSSHLESFASHGSVSQPEADEEQEMRVLIETALEKNQMLYLCHCDSSIPLHRCVLNLANHIKWKFWIIFYYQFSNGNYCLLPPVLKALIFSQSLNLLESYIRMRHDQGFDSFHWILDSHSGLHATSYIICQLQNSESQPAPELLQRGRQTLRAMRDLHANSDSRVWSFLKNKIDHVLSPAPDQTEVSDLPDLPDPGGFDPSFMVADMDFSKMDDWLIRPEDIT